MSQSAGFSLAALRKRDIIGSVDALEDRVLSAERALLEVRVDQASTATQVADLAKAHDAAVAGLHAKLQANVDELAASIAADVRRLTEEDTLLAARVQAQEEELRRELSADEAKDVQAVIRWVEKQVATMAGAMQGKADAEHVVELDATIEDFQQHLEKITQQVQSKAAAVQLDSLASMVSNSAQKLDAVEKAVWEKTSTDQSLRRLAAELEAMQKDVAQVRKEAEERARQHDHSQTVFDAVCTMRSQVTNVERLAQRKADSDEVSQLFTNMTSLRADFVNIESVMAALSSSVDSSKSPEAANGNGRRASVARSAHLPAGLGMSASMPTLSPGANAGARSPSGTLKKSPTAAAGAAVLRK